MSEQANISTYCQDEFPTYPIEGKSRTLRYPVNNVPEFTFSSWLVRQLKMPNSRKR